MEAGTILSIILLSFIGIERIIKHLKKSTCCRNEVEFDTEASAPNFRLP